jgi:pyrimidine oxygenase
MHGWLISTTSPQYMPSFKLNLEIVQNAERYGLDLALSMIKLRRFGGASEFWDHNLESFTLMAGLAADGRTGSSGSATDGQNRKRARPVD